MKISCSCMPWGSSARGRKSSLFQRRVKRKQPHPDVEDMAGDAYRNPSSGGAWSTDLGKQERKCPQCQGELQHIGEEVSERLEYVPASLYVIEEACQKYACGKGCTVVTAQKADAADREGSAGTGLLAHVAVSKYGDHLPLYRQEGIYQAPRSGRIPQNHVRLDARCAELVRPLFERMKEQVLESKALQTDDTPVAVLDPALRARARGGSGPMSG